MLEVTRLLDAVATGDRQAAADLLPLVYDELKTLAAARLAAEAPGHSLNPTALVHEAYLRLVGEQQFVSRGHFFAAAAEAMRRILVDHARHKNRLKRGGGAAQTDIATVDLAAPLPSVELLDLDIALNKLTKVYPVHARLVILRYFGGQTLPEAAQILGISDSTADRYWAFARAWLRAEIADPTREE